jgi:Argininosuccinate lyase
MWGGRFSEATDAFVAEFTASVQFDQRFYKQDIAGSIAHATMLAKVGVLTEQERDDIIEGLTAIKADIEAGNFEWRIDLEDVHMNIESRLTQRIGITGKKLHTAVAVMTRLQQISVCMSVMKSMPSWNYWKNYKKASWVWQLKIPIPSCQVLPICKLHSQ